MKYVQIIIYISPELEINSNHPPFQGKELEKIFLEEGVIDKEENEQEVQQEKEDVKPAPPKVPEVIGHTDSGELVVIVKGKGRGRPKGKLAKGCLVVLRTMTPVTGLVPSAQN